MRPGGGGAKGAAFERKTGVALSIWLTQGRRADLFSRNVLSGGRFTIAEKAGRELGTPGDLMAAHPLAFEFLSRFLVECKHTKTIQLDQFIFDRTEKTWLSKVVAKAKKEANTMDVDFMVIACQNRRPTLVFMPIGCGKAAADMARPKNAVVFHKFHNDTLWCCALDDLVGHVRSDRFLAALPPRSPAS